MIVLDSVLLFISSLELGALLATLLLRIFNTTDKKIIAIASIVIMIVLLISLLIVFIQRAKNNKLIIQKLASSLLKGKPQDTSSVTEEIRRWKQLYNEGAITEEMFNQKRDELLKR